MISYLSDYIFVNIYIYLYTGIICVSFVRCGLTEISIPCYIRVFFGALPFCKVLSVLPVPLIGPNLTVPFLQHKPLSGNQRTTLKEKQIIKIVSIIFI